MEFSRRRFAFCTSPLSSIHWVISGFETVIRTELILKYASHLGIWEHLVIIKRDQHFKEVGANTSLTLETLVTYMTEKGFGFLNILC